MPAQACQSSSVTQDVEVGSTQESEKSFLLADRRTSSFDEEPHVTASRSHSRSVPAKTKSSLQVGAEPPTPTSDQQSADPAKRLKGLGLAGIATVFQSVMSVCAKILGEFC